MSRKEDFEKAAEDYCEDHSHCIYFEFGAEYGYQYAQTHPNWISVEDELPKVQDWYLCYNDVEDGSEVLHWEGDGNVWMDNDWHYKSKEITHWMTLPQPPRKEE